MKVWDPTGKKAGILATAPISDFAPKQSVQM